MNGKMNRNISKYLSILIYLREREREKKYTKTING
jgi:hypothetical protein